MLIFEQNGAILSMKGRNVRRGVFIKEQLVLLTIAYRVVVTLK